VIVQSHILKNSVAYYCVLCLGGVPKMSESEINITERLQKIGQTIQDYKDTLVAHFKDMEVDVKDWNFAVGKTEKEYTVEISVKLGIKPKAKK
jgi:hypothetical protein